jgi:hypothetical protein
MPSENEILRMYDELQKDQTQLLLDLKNLKESDDAHKMESNIHKEVSVITQLLCSLLKLKKLKKNKMSL